MYQEDGVRRLGGFPQPAIFNGVFGHIYQIDAPASAYGLWPQPFTFRREGNCSALPAVTLLPAGKEEEVEAGAGKIFRGAAQIALVDSAADAEARRGGDMETAQAMALATGVLGLRKIRHNISDACAACRKSKVKCDEVKPCTRCIKTSQTCRDWRTEAPHPERKDLTSPPHDRPTGTAVSTSDAPEQACVKAPKSTKRRPAPAANRHGLVLSHSLIFPSCFRWLS
jgi:hypothetical protein